MATLTDDLRRYFKVDFLSDYLGGRRNNYTFLRLLFAILVMFGHGYILTTYHGRPRRDPLSHLIMFGSSWVGAIAVDGFFFISGILIVQSYRRRQDLNSFLTARMLRIYPGAIVCVLLSVLVIGPLLTSLNLGAYFSRPELYAHLIRNTLLFDVDFLLPGVFTHHPNSAINGSLWTLPIELRCYGYVALFGLLGLLRKGWRANIAMGLLIALALWRRDLLPLIGGHEMFLIPGLYFAAGAFCCMNARFIPLTAWIMLPLLAAYCCAFHSPYIRIVFGFTLCYGILFAAYRLPLMNLDRWGDFSYGVYIYAFPVQQVLIATIHQIGPRLNFILAFPITLGLAVLSWFFVEKPCLAFVRKHDTAKQECSAQIGVGAMPPLQIVEARNPSLNENFM